MPKLHCPFISYVKELFVYVSLLAALLYEWPRPFRNSIHSIPSTKKFILPTLIWVALSSFTNHDCPHPHLFLSQFTVIDPIWVLVFRARECCWHADFTVFCYIFIQPSNPTVLKNSTSFWSLKNVSLFAFEYLSFYLIFLVIFKFFCCLI